MIKVLSITNYVMSDGQEEYLLRPMTTDHDTFAFPGNYEDMLERFEVITFDPPDTTPGQASGYTEGDLWLEVQGGTLADPINGNIYVVVNQSWVETQDQTLPAPVVPPYYKDVWETFLFQTKNNYIGNKQVLSTPFLFYFGLRPEKTALDILIKYFGPKGAFPTPTPNIPYIPAPTPTYITPSPMPSSPAPSPSWYPGITPTPSPSPQISFSLDTTSMIWDYDSVGWLYSDNTNLNMSNILNWYLSSSAEGGGAPVYYLSYIEFKDGKPLKLTPSSGLPSWMTMEVNQGTWQTVQANQTVFIFI